MKISFNEIIKSNKRFAIPIILVFLVIIIYFICFGIKTSGYNKQVDLYNRSAKKYNTLSSKVAVYNLNGFYESVPELEHVKSGPLSIIKSRVNGNTIKKIKKDTLTLEELTDELKSKIEIANLLNCPEESWVIEKLKEIKEITEIKSVDLNNNPDGILGREGGYKACIYFELSEIDSKTVQGDNPVEKGTDGGGAVEIYENRKRAEERCSYLSEFDNTILYSGSYAAVGTMVIRTSYLLDKDAQLKITNEITKAMTKTK